MIKLIASDLDGTLLTTYKQLTQRLLSVLKKAYEKNIILVPLPEEHLPPYQGMFLIYLLPNI